MEDAHCCNLDGATCLIGVFDGHGGKEAAIYVAKYIIPKILASDKFEAGDYESSLSWAFLHMDEMMSTDLGRKELNEIRSGKNGPGDMTSMAGCTAVFAMIVNNILYVANSGDSR
jgi:serine/threonine protein phosphatase PrpC